MRVGATAVIVPVLVGVHGVEPHQIERPLVYTQPYVAERIDGGEVSETLIVKSLTGERRGDRRLMVLIRVVQEFHLQPGVPGFRACPMRRSTTRRPQADVCALDYVLKTQ
jgi:hypothetical protein